MDEPGIEEKKSVRSEINKGVKGRDKATEPKSGNATAHSESRAPPRTPRERTAVGHAMPPLTRTTALQAAPRDVDEALLRREQRPEQRPEQIKSWSPGYSNSN